MIAIETLRSLLEAAFPGARVDVSDMTGTSDHFEASIVAAQFAGKSRLDQHKMVYAALGDRVGKEIHALALSTRAPG